METHTHVDGSARARILIRGPHGRVIRRRGGQRRVRRAEEQREVDHILRLRQIFFVIASEARHVFTHRRGARTYFSANNPHRRPSICGDTPSVDDLSRSLSALRRNADSEAACERSASSSCAAGSGMRPWSELHAPQRRQCPHSRAAPRRFAPPTPRAAAQRGTRPPLCAAPPAPAGMSERWIRKGNLPDLGEVRKVSQSRGGESRARAGVGSERTGDVCDGSAAEVQLAPN